MKILKSVLLVIIGLALLVMLIALFLPGKLKIVSQKEINLPVNKVYYSLSTFADHGKWDPWLEKDSTAKIVITLSDGTVGSKYSWTSKKSGAGEMVIDSVVPGKHIALTLAFEGMNQKAYVWNDLTDNNGKTIVTWGFQQKASFPVGRIFMALIKGKLRKDYDRGLSNLKRLLESEGVRMSSLTGIVEKEVPGFDAMVASGKGSMEEISMKLGGLFGQAMAAVQEQKLQISGAPFSRYMNYDPQTQITEFEAGFPVVKAGKSKGDVKAVTVKSFTAIQAMHTGPYDEFDISYGDLMKYIQGNNISIAPESWEFYLTDPQTVNDPLKWQTIIALPLIK